MWISAPLKIIKLFFSFIVGGWKLGMKLVPFFPICFIAALGGFVGAFYIIVMTGLFAPAVISIYLYIKN